MTKVDNRKNLTQWKLPIYVYSDLNKALKSGFNRDGIYQIRINEHASLDILVKNSELFSKCETLIVGFGGAIMNRGKKKGPFFSGLSITDDIEAPCLLISDPTLDLSQKISLSWYAGSETNPHLRPFIVDLLNGISQLYQVRIVLFGGSGAGFAILSLINSLVAGSLAFVWNPQTSISRYFPNFVHRYLEVAFPNSLAQLRPGESESEATNSAAYEKALEETGIVHNLLKENYDACHNTIFFLQNRHDWHLDQHANPYLTRIGQWTRLAPAVFVNEAKTAAMVIGDWGAGHAVPPRELIHSLLGLCATIIY